MREYGMDYPAVLKLPLKTFWSLNKQVNRLRAEADQRLLRLFASAQSPEAYKETQQSLSNEVESPTVVQKGFDEDQFLRLQSKFGGKVNTK